MKTKEIGWSRCFEYIIQMTFKCMIGMSRKITSILLECSDMKTSNAGKKEVNVIKKTKGFFRTICNICLVSKYIFSTNHFNRMFSYDMPKLVFEVYVRVSNFLESLSISLLYEHTHPKNNKHLQLYKVQP